MATSSDILQQLPYPQDKCNLRDYPFSRHQACRHKHCLSAQGKSCRSPLRQPQRKFQQDISDTSVVLVYPAKRQRLRINPLKTNSDLDKQLQSIRHHLHGYALIVGCNIESLSTVWSTRFFKTDLVFTRRTVCASTVISIADGAWWTRQACVAACCVVADVARIAAFATRIETLLTERAQEPCTIIF